MSSRGRAKLLLRSNQSWSMVYDFYDKKSPAVMYIMIIIAGHGQLILMYARIKLLFILCIFVGELLLDSIHYLAEMRSIV